MLEEGLPSTLVLDVCGLQMAPLASAFLHMPRKVVLVSSAKASWQVHTDGRAENATSMWSMGIMAQFLCSCLSCLRERISKAAISYIHLHTPYSLPQSGRAPTDHGELRTSTKPQTASVLRTTKNTAKAAMLLESSSCIAETLRVCAGVSFAHFRASPDNSKSHKTASHATDVSVG